MDRGLDSGGLEPTAVALAASWSPSLGNEDAGVSVPPHWPSLAYVAKTQTGPAFEP